MADEKIHNWQEDPDALEAIKERQDPYDVAIVRCPYCGGESYYNQGSHAGCRWCNRDLSGFLNDDGTDVVTSIGDIMDSEAWAAAAGYNDKYNLLPESPWPAPAETITCPKCGYQWTSNMTFSEPWEGCPSCGKRAINEKS